MTENNSEKSGWHIEKSGGGYLYLYYAERIIASLSKQGIWIEKKEVIITDGAKKIDDGMYGIRIKIKEAK